jgi:Protein of unknown function (DUF2568)
MPLPGAERAITVQTGKSANLGLSFLLELCALAALAYWGFQVSNGPVVAVVLGIGAPLLTALIWGRFAAPASRTRLPMPWLLILKVVIFALAAAALAGAGQPGLAGVFAVVVVINLALAQLWGQE